jgi:hypothetical protein
MCDERVKINQKLIDQFPKPESSKVVVLRDSELIGFTAHISSTCTTFRFEKSVNAKRHNIKLGRG